MFLLSSCRLLHYIFTLHYLFAGTKALILVIGVASALSRFCFPDWLLMWASVLRLVQCAAGRGGWTSRCPIWSLSMRSSTATQMKGSPSPSQATKWVGSGALSAHLPTRALTHACSHTCMHSHVHALTHKRTHTWKRRHTILRRHTHTHFQDMFA